MNKFLISIFIIIIIIFGGIIFTTQGNVNFKSDNKLPSLPPDASTLRLLTPIPQNQRVLGTQQSLPQSQAQTQQQLPPQATQPTFGVEKETQATYSAIISTSKGDVRVTLFASDAPKTVRNFLDKAKNGYYKNLTFHRVEDWVVQGGDPKGDGTGGGLMPTELNGRPFLAGSLGIARGSSIQVSNDSQFFFTKTDASWLDKQYTNFGMVTDGMDVVNQIQIGDKILGITVEN